VGLTMVLGGGGDLMKCFINIFYVKQLYLGSRFYRQFFTERLRRIQIYSVTDAAVLKKTYVVATTNDEAISRHLRYT
jgi:hypothetical protein